MKPCRKNWRNTKMSKIAVMCGHGTQTNGKWDSGTTYAGYNEAALMLPITKAAVKYLRASGLTVISDADKNNNKNMVSDVAWANKEKVALYVSIHCDYSKAPSGVMPLYVSDKGKKLATALNTAIKNGMPMKSRGVVKRTDLYELNMTDAPAVILETGSIKADLKILKNNADKYGKLIAKGICSYLGIKQSDPQPAPEPQTHLYRVRKAWKDANSQVGAYKSLENAKKECDKHKGYSVFDENGKAVYTTPAPEPTNAEKIVAKAKEFAWTYGTAAKTYAYKTGSAKTAYKTALKKWLGKTAKISQSDCGYFVTTCVRASGVSSDFLCLPANGTKPYPSLPSSMQIVHTGSMGSFALKAGDVIRWQKTNKHQHTVIYIGNGVIAHASREHAFPRMAKATPWTASNTKTSTLQVLRAK